VRLNNFEPKNYVVWFIMAFQSGVINAGGFLACHRFVTHTTGFATHFGVDIASTSLMNALGMLSVPLFFLVGAMLAAFLVDRKKLKAEAPYYSFVFIIISSLLFFVAFAGIRGFFGVFGTELQIFKDYFLLAALSMASGLQNATINPPNGTSIRTTHLTGLTTDLGVGVVRLFSGSLLGDQRKKEILYNWIRVGIIGFFIFGSALGAYLFIKYRYYGFLIPAFISLFVFTHLQWQDKKTNRLN